MVCRYRCCFSGVSATPSIIPSTYPFMAVRGVLRSWEIFLISSFSSLSEIIFSCEVSLRITLISSKSRHTSPISSRELLGISKSRLPILIFWVASLSLSKGIIMEPYIHKSRKRLVITRMKITEIIPCTPILLICGITCSRNVTIYTLITSPDSSLKLNCLTIQLYSPPL